MPPEVPKADTARVPVVVTGLPETEKMPGIVNPTDVTVPVPDTEAQLVDEPFVVKNLPEFPV